MRLITINNSRIAVAVPAKAKTLKERFGDARALMDEGNRSSMPTKRARPTKREARLSRRVSDWDSYLQNRNGGPHHYRRPGSMNK